MKVTIKDYNDYMGITELKVNDYYVYVDDDLDGFTILDSNYEEVELFPDDYFNIKFSVAKHLYLKSKNYVEKLENKLYKK